MKSRENNSGFILIAARIALVLGILNLLLGCGDVSESNVKSYNNHLVKKVVLEGHEYWLTSKGNIIHSESCKAFH